MDVANRQAFHGPKNLSISIAIIGGAPSKQRSSWSGFTGHRPRQDSPPYSSTPLNGRLRPTKPMVDGSAGILVYCLSLGNTLNLDVSPAVLGKRGTKRSVGPTSIATRRMSSGSQGR